MEVRRYLNIIRRRLILILAIVAAGLTAGFLITPRGDSYTSTATLYVGSRSISLEAGSPDVSGDRTVGLDRLAQTFVAMLESDEVVEGAVERADVDRTTDEVLAATSAEQVVSTNLIDVSVTDSDPSVARALADAVAVEFSALIRQFEPNENSLGEPVEQNLVSIFEPADLPEVPNQSQLFRNLALGMLLGLVIAGGVVALLEHLDITLRSTEDVERRLELPVLGVVPALGTELPVARASSVRRPLGRDRGAPVV